jgi:hypothetical protein
MKIAGELTLSTQSGHLRTAATWRFNGSFRRTLTALYSMANL